MLKLGARASRAEVGSGEERSSGRRRDSINRRDSLVCDYAIAITIATAQSTNGDKVKVTESEV